MRRKRKTVSGLHLPAPRLTLRGYAYLILPPLAALALLDALLYLLVRYGFDRCYGIWCFF